MKIVLDIADEGLSALKNVDITFLKCSHENCYNKKAVEKRVRPYHSLHFILDGKGYFNFKNTDYTLSKGQSFLLYANEEYCYKPDTFDPWSYIWIDFLCDKAEDLFALCGFEKETPYITVKDMDSMQEKFLMMIDAYDTSAVQSIQCTSFFLLIIAMLIEGNNSLKTQYGKGGYRKFRYVRDAIIYINNNYRIQIGVNEIASSVNISPSYLNSIFVEEIGVSPLQFLLMIRIANACELLHQKNLNVSEVAYQVGFNDPLYFSRCFYKFKGISPRGYASQFPDEDPFEFFKSKNIDFR